MKPSELIGRTITDIFCVFGTQDGWLDTADCVIEVDGSLYIGFPWSVDDEQVQMRDLPDRAVSLFDKRSGVPILGRRLCDVVQIDRSEGPAYLLLEDGSLITEKTMAPHGTGHAGLRYYQSSQQLTAEKGRSLRRLFT